MKILNAKLLYFCTWIGKRKFRNTLAENSVFSGTLQREKFPTKDENKSGILECWRWGGPQRSSCLIHRTELE